MNYDALGENPFRPRVDASEMTAGELLAGLVWEARKREDRAAKLDFEFGGATPYDLEQDKYLSANAYDRQEPEAEPVGKLIDFCNLWGLDQATTDWLHSFPEEVQASVISEFKPNIWPKERILDVAEFEAMQEEEESAQLVRDDADTDGDGGPRLRRNTLTTAARGSAAEPVQAAEPLKAPQLDGNPPQDVNDDFPAWMREEHGAPAEMPEWLRAAGAQGLHSSSALDRCIAQADADMRARRASENQAASGAAPLA